MATTESIKRRIRALEDECAEADTTVRALVEASGQDLANHSPTVLLFEAVVARLCKRSDSLVTAIRRADRG